MGWINLGIKTPQLGEVTYYSPSANGTTFRFTPGNLGGFAAFKTYCLVRMYWAEGVKDMVTRARRIYPREGSFIWDFPIPEQLVPTGGVVWYPIVEKFVYWKWRGRSQEPAWTLQIEEFDPNFPATSRALDGGIY